MGRHIPRKSRSISVIYDNDRLFRTAMPPAQETSPARGVKRVLQACENCRRKKTRCPGEKPRCSNCTRLRQICQYAGVEDEDDEPSNEAKRTKTLEDRLAQLEEKLDRVLDGPKTPAQGERSDQISGHDERPMHPVPSSNRPRHPSSASFASSLIPPWPIMADAITTYFRCSHRQPVWLFERAEELTQDTAEELSLVVLGISLQYSQQDSPPFHNTTLQAPSTYTDAARSLIMLKLANATVAMQTLQALCLLATSNLVAGDLQLAAFHSSLLANLLQSSGLEARASSPDRVDPAIEEARRLFWSLQSQISMCALPIHIPSTLDIESPAFSIPDEPSSRPGGKAPLLPVEAPGDAQPQTDRSLGIWAHQVRSASLWALVRAHVSRCAEGDTAKTSSLPPWHPQSDYTVINALLLDMECAFPISFRYDAARFPFRSPESIERRREFWLPWMRIQVGYHTLHAVLNHPFLYSSRVSSPHPGPNAFWKTSTDLALLHSTWIARLIGMAGEKGLELSDPFFVHAAAVAVTLHLYWSRAADPKIHAPAKENLVLCRSFVAKMATRWPFVQRVANDVDSLIRLAMPKDHEQDEDKERENQPANSRDTAATSSPVFSQISLVWEILDFASSRRLQTGNALFHTPWAAAIRPSHPPRYASHDQTVLEDPAIEGSPPADYRTTAGSYAEAPDWFSPEVTNLPPAEETVPNSQQSEAVQEAVSSNTIMPAPELRQQNLTADYPGWAWNPATDTGIFYNPFTQFGDRSGGADMSWWDCGNL